MCPEIEAPDCTDKEAMESFCTTIKQKITTIQEQTSIGENPQMAWAKRSSFSPVKSSPKYDTIPAWWKAPVAE